MSIYKERTYHSYGIVEFAGIRLKPYTIAAAGREAIDVQPALDYATYALPESSIPWMRHRGLGYLMYHAGEDGDWFLLRVWVDGDIQAGHIAANQGRGFQPLTVPFYECVWESVIACHERNAWVRHMMSVDPDSSGYLSDRLPDGLH